MTPPDVSTSDSQPSRDMLDGIDVVGIGKRLWAHKWSGFVFVVVFVALAIFYLHNSTYRYSASLTLTPADQSGSGGSKAAGGLSSLGSLVGLNLSGGQGSAFALYSEAITSSPVAEELSRDPVIMHEIFKPLWDAKTNRWAIKQPSEFRKGVKSLLGMPNRPWMPPTAADLQQYIEQNVKVDEDLKKNLVKLIYKYEDPKFAAYFLQALNTKSDAFLRARSLARSSIYVQYLDRRLREVQVAEYRQALSEALGAYEKTVMMASSRASFAADPFGEVQVSVGPTSPNPKMVLVLSVVMGLAFWIFYVLILKAIWRALRSPARDEIEA